MKNNQQLMAKSRRVKKIRPKQRKSILKTKKLVAQNIKVLKEIQK